MPQLWSNDYVYVDKSSRQNFYVFLGSEGRIQTNDLINNNNITTILDYGCGYSNSIQYSCNHFNITNIQISKYDPFIPEYSTYPNTTFDLVVCHNVLQFVEYQFINDTVQDIANLTNKLALFNISIPTSIVISNTVYDTPTTVSNSNPVISKYINALQAANLNIIDSKINTVEDRLKILVADTTDEVKASIASSNTLVLTILASKV